MDRYINIKRKLSPKDTKMGKVAKINRASSSQGLWKTLILQIDLNFWLTRPTKSLLQSWIRTKRKPGRLRFIFERKTPTTLLI